MSSFLHKIAKYFVMDQTEAKESLTVQTRYKHFRRTLIVVMTVITLSPILIATTLSFYQYRNLLNSEATNYLRWNAESTKKTVEFFLTELVKVMSYLTSEYDCDQLSDQTTLGEVFLRLKREYPGVVDLSVLDSTGTQQAYAGPYDLQGKNYSKRVWFPSAVTREYYISSVFLGYRKVPHFVITVSKKTSSPEFCWILKASIDAETLNKFISTTKTEASDDIFLIDYQGDLQTSSRYYGEAKKGFFSLRELPNRGGITLKVNMAKNSPELRAYAYLHNTPWILVLIKKGYAYGENWTLFKNQMLTILLISTGLVMFAILRTANILVKRVRQGDEAREAILSEVEHTGKLASIGRLAAGVAHEINNPLAIINQKAGLMADLLEVSSDFQYKEKFLEQLNGVQNAVSRCKIITHRLLGFARRMDVTPEPVVINELIKEVLTFLDKEVLYRGIRMDLNLQENLPKIRSDRGQLQQIFLNIINNAIDAVGNDGLVRISTLLKDDQFLHIDIADNGPGISPEAMKHIFEPFFTTKTKGEHKGTGLGLSITYGLVQKLGGQISVSSELGKGTTFTVLLPLEK